MVGRIMLRARGVGTVIDGNKEEAAAVMFFVCYLFLAKYSSKGTPLFCLPRGPICY